MDKREIIEAELRSLHSAMYYAHDEGDWKMARSMERTIKSLKDAKTVEEIAGYFGLLYESLKDDIAKREEMRARIEELENELQGLDG